jgi:O-antigen ligase
VSLTGLIFLAGFFTGCVLAFARHPIFGLMTYVAVFYLHPPSRWWGASMPDLRWSMFAAVVTLVALLIRKKEVKPDLPVFSHKVMIGLVMFFVWTLIQSLWALDAQLHSELVVLFAKYILLVALIYKCVDSEKNLRLFLWTHVLGCLYLGWLTYTTYRGGRFEGFGGPGIDEANSGGLQIVTGIFVASSLFLMGSMKERLGLFGTMPFIINALITTISRSGFLATGCGGLIFNFFSPKPLRKVVRVLSVLAIALFLLLTNDTYWGRIESLKHRGEAVEGVDTGAKRLEIMEAQWRMFLAHPLGCGHRCTAVLSTRYMGDHLLTGRDENKARSSHNTFMTLLVEQGVPGALLYVLMLLWIARKLLSLRRQYSAETSFVSQLLPAMAAILGAITIGDMFVDYLKFEARLWFLAILMVIVRQTVVARTAEAPVATRAVAHAGARAKSLAKVAR